MKTEFDDILKKKWDAVRFPVDPQHREEMARLLDSRNRRRGGFIWWLSGLLLLVAIGGVLAYINLSSEATTSVQSSTDANMESHFSQPSGQGIESAPSISNRSSDTQKTNSIDGKDNFNENETSTINHDQTSTSKQSLTKGSPTSNSSQGKNRNKKSPSKPDMASLKTNDDQIPSQQIISITENGITTPDQINDEADIIIEENGNEEVVVDLARSTNITAPLEDIDITQLDIENDRPGQVEPLFKKIHPVHVYVDASAGYIPGAGEINSGWSIRSGAGIGYALFPKTDVLLSAGYLLQKDGFDFERTSTLQQPDFGARSSFHTLTPDKLHFIYSKIGVQHRVHRHLISILGGAQWLYGAQGTIVIQEQNQFAISPVETTRYAWLKLEGMQRLLWSGELNYGYQFMPRISLQFGVKYYFTHLKKEDEDLEQQGYYWKGKFAPFNPSFTFNYRFYGK